MFDLTGHVPQWTLYGAVLAAAALAMVAYWAGTHRRRGGPPGAQTPRPASRGDLLAAAVASAVAADGMWATFADLGMPIPLRILTFGFLELAVLQSARRARRSMLENYSAGVDGIAMWALTCVSAVLSALHEVTAGNPNIAVVAVRFVAPLVAAWGWERHMSLERRTLRGRAAGINWRVTPARIAVALGLADAEDRTVTEVDTARRLTRVAVATARLEAAQSGGRWGARRRAAARQRAAFREAMEHTDLAHDAELQARLEAETAALIGAASFAAMPHRPFWMPAPPAVDPRPVVCAGPYGMAGTVAVRVRERGKFRVLFPGPPSVARTDGARTEVRASDRLMRRMRLERAAAESMRAARTAAEPGPVRDRTGSPDEGRTDVVEDVPQDRAGEVIPFRTEPRTDAEQPARAEPARTEQASRTAPSAARTGRTGAVSVPVQDDRKPREHWVPILADEIRTEGRTWRPDYAALEARTGWGRSWCEKTVRAARTAAEAEPGGERTGTDD